MVATPAHCSADARPASWCAFRPAPSSQRTAARASVFVLDGGQARRARSAGGLHRRHRGRTAQRREPRARPSSPTARPTSMTASTSPVAGRLTHETARVPDPPLPVHAGGVPVPGGAGHLRLHQHSARGRPLHQDPGLLHHRHLPGRRPAGPGTPGRQADRGSPGRARGRAQDRDDGGRRRRRSSPSSSRPGPTRTRSTTRSRARSMRCARTCRRTSRAWRSAASVPALVNIMQLALVSADAPYRELEDHARALEGHAEDRDRRAHRGELGISAARAARGRRPAAPGAVHASRPASWCRRCRARTPTSPRASSTWASAASASRLPAPTNRSTRCATP